MRKVTRLMSASSSEESNLNTSAPSESLIVSHKRDTKAVPKKKGPGAILKKKS